MTCRGHAEAAGNATALRRLGPVRARRAFSARRTSQLVYNGLSLTERVETLVGGSWVT
jgi:hypothetical protein